TPGEVPAQDRLCVRGHHDPPARQRAVVGGGPRLLGGGSDLQRVPPPRVRAHQAGAAPRPTPYHAAAARRSHPGREGGAPARRDRPQAPREGPGVAPRRVLAELSTFTRTEYVSRPDVRI